jgi:hypothetical protein
MTLHYVSGLEAQHKAMEACPKHTSTPLMCMCLPQILPPSPPLSYPRLLPVESICVTRDVRDHKHRITHYTYSRHYHVPIHSVCVGLIKCVLSYLLVVSRTLQTSKQTITQARLDHIQQSLINQFTLHKNMQVRQVWSTD